MVKKKGLGRGLGALIGGGSHEAAEEPAPAPVVTVAPVQVPDGDRILHLDPHDVKPNPKQPRSTFREEGLEELAESIRRDGVQEPIIVRRTDGGFELVSGERRVRASIMAGAETVPAVCRDISDRDMLKLGLIENIQREDLNPIELAVAYQALIEEFGWTQEQLSTEVGKKRVTVTNTLRLLNLPADIQRYVMEDVLSMGHARALLSIPSPEEQRKAAKKIIEGGLSVREAEKLAAPKPPAKPKPTVVTDPNIAELEGELRHMLGTKVHLRSTKKNTGKIEIEYYSLDELDRILTRLRSGR